MWTSDHLHSCTGASEQKAINLATNARVALTTGCNRWKDGLDIVVEGVAVRVTDAAILQTLTDLWRAEYQGDWDFAVRDGAFHRDDGGSADVYAVPPDKVLAFAKGRFAQTRFRFAGT